MYVDYDVEASQAGPTRTERPPTHAPTQQCQRQYMRPLQTIFLSYLIFDALTYV